jgi:hypothetical protein
MSPELVLGLLRLLQLDSGWFEIAVWDISVLMVVSYYGSAAHR